MRRRLGENGNAGVTHGTNAKGVRLVCASAEHNAWNAKPRANGGINLNVEKAANVQKAVRAKGKGTVEPRNVPQAGVCKRKRSANEGKAVARGNATRQRSNRTNVHKQRMNAVGTFIKRCGKGSMRSGKRR